MARKIFVNLAVKRLDRSKAFFERLGFAFNPRFTSEDAACMVIADDIYAMLLTEARFRDFTPKPVADATRTTEVLTCLTMESRADRSGSGLSRSIGVRSHNPTSCSSWRRREGRARNVGM